ncbi:DNA double-strand break repair nuclease NurA [Candidatus Bathyarchaeota archaeon]|nr:DNA double-strand break repair nuclease NurA [Candidatus Bathyarchaeota archaeon]
MVIEQYTITTTPKYNFPQNTIDTSLPQRFIELSLYSLKHVQNQAIQIKQQIQQNPFNNQETLVASQFTPPTQAIPLNPKPEPPTTIAAVDTSSIKLGETNKGIIIAIRGTTVWKQAKNYAYLRVGPFIFHITEDNLQEVYNTLLKAYFPEQSHQLSPGFIQIPTRMANLLEKWLQASLVKTISNGIILFDGSLTAGTADTPTQQLKEILAAARSMGNTVLAFTKVTTLRFNGCLITEAFPAYKPPCLIEVANIKPKPPLTLLGEVYVAKLARGNYAFRLDVDRELPAQKRIEAVERLLGNDLIMQGYPETLRLAHILCTFTANEVIAMQHFIQQRYRLKIIDRPDMHRLLFGPFGKGESHHEAI